MTEQEAIKTVLALAASEIGYQEKASNAQLDDKYANAGHANWTKYARDLDAALNFYNGKKNGYDWCDMFTDWLFLHSFGATIAMTMLCQPQRSGGAGCQYSAGYYQSAGRWVTTPQPGDQIFFYSGGGINHTGIVENVINGQVITIEGNSADQVGRHTYPLGASYIAGYGRPIWAAAAASGVEYVEPTYEIPTTITLSFGMVSEDVRKMQEMLIKLGYSCGPDGADGDFGMNTYAALVQFQTDYALTVDGQAGDLTLNALKEALKKKEGNASSSTPESSGSSSATPTPEPAPAPTQDTGFKVGDIVNFVGKRHYTMATGNFSRSCRPGKARITIIHQSKNTKHPYHLIKVAGSTSTVFGWVDEKDIEKA